MHHVPQQYESVVLTQCKALLTKLYHQGKLTWRRATTTGIPRGYRNGKMVFSPNKDGEGLPDLIIGLPAGTTLWLETKSETGRLSPAQERFKNEFEAFGHHYRIARSVGQLESILQAFGVETRTWIK